MKYLVIILAFVISSNFCVSQQKFTLVKEINLNNFNSKKLDKISAEFNSGKKSVSKYKAIDINNILELCDNCFIEIEDKNKNNYYLSSNDINKDINSQQVLLLFDEKFSSLGDTLVIGEDELTKIENNELLEIELGSISNIRYSLNSKGWDSEKTKLYFRPNSIIYPFDNSTIRWITDIVKIRVFRRK